MIDGLFSELPLFGSSVAPITIKGQVNVNTEYSIDHAGYLKWTLRLRDLKSDTEIHVSDHEGIRGALVQLRQYPSVVGTGDA